MRYSCFKGEVSEWSNEPVSKTGVPQGTAGSNPALSACRERRRVCYTFSMSTDLTQLVIDGYSGEGALKFYGDKVANGLWISEKHYIEKYFKLKNTEGTKVLDVGCGAGRTTIPLMQAGYDVIGIDFIPEMIETAKKISQEKNLDVKYEVGDATALNFPDNSFDHVLFSNQGWTQIPGQAQRLQALTEIYRVLRPGGVFIFSARERTFWYDFPLWLEQWIKVRILKPVGFPIQEEDYGDLFYEREPGDRNRTYAKKQFIHFFSKAEAKGELEKAGFTFLEADGSMQISLDSYRTHPPVLFISKK